MDATGPGAHFPRLFSPLRLGPITLINRIVFTAHLTNFAVDGLPTDGHAAYYAARAAGGAGLIIAEEQTVHPSDRADEKLIRGYDRAAVTGYRAITQAVHAHGTPIFAQLNHNGGQGSGLYTGAAVRAPSAVADPHFREQPLTADEDFLTELIASYANVARRCVDGGFDGIEIQCSQSSIVAQFLSGATNLRDDDWGGPIANRARLMIDIIAAVRAAVGPEVAVGVRLCGDELLKDGTTLDEAVQTARLVQATGQLDYVNTAIGVATSSMYMIAPGMRVPRDYAIYIPDAIRAGRRDSRLPVV